MNINHLKIVCILDIENRGFAALYSNYEHCDTIKTLVSQVVFRYQQGAIIDILKEQEVVKLSLGGVLDKDSDEWNLALISDSYDAKGLMEIMYRYGLFSDSTLILYHNKPQGLLELLTNGDKAIFFAKAKGLHEGAMGCIYPYIFPILSAIAQPHNNSAQYKLYLETLAEAIMYKDPDFLTLKGNFDNTAKPQEEYSEKEKIYSKIFND